MDLNKLPLFAALQRKMQWLNQRQEVLAQNIANADTPGYTPSDLQPLNFDDLLGKADGGTGAPEPTLMPVATNPMHISTATADGFDIEKKQGSFQSSPTGNAVNLEDQMVKLAQTQMDYAAATSLYKKQVQLLKIAVGKG